MERSRDWMDQAEGDLPAMPTKSSGSVRIFYPAFDRAGLLRTLRERLERLEASLPIVRVVLFGSYARGSYTVGSDVDLLIVYRGEPRPDAYAVTRRALAIPRLEPHLYAEAEYEAAQATVDRMIQGGITLTLALSPRGRGNDPRSC